MPRPRLLDRLREGFEGPLTLVTAPAGFGKTTLIADALASFPGPAGWVTVDEHDNHLPTFGRHLVGAIQTAFPDACRTTLGLLWQPRSPSVDLLTRTLANELAELPRGCLLALDEYEAIRLHRRRTQQLEAVRGGAFERAFEHRVAVLEVDAPAGLDPDPPRYSTIRGLLAHQE